MGARIDPGVAPGRQPQRQPMAALTHVVGRHAIDSDRGKQERHHGKRRQRRRGESPPRRRFRHAIVHGPNNPSLPKLIIFGTITSLLVVLETLTPAERVAFVLHDMFDVPFEDITTVVGRSEPAVRHSPAGLAGE